MGKAFLVAGLGFGDEGKGTIVDHLARTTGARLVVRYTGGAQAGHNVVLDDGRQHCFSQFGAASLVHDGVNTVITSDFCLNPLTLKAEEQHLRELGVKTPLYRLIVDHDALVTTHYHVVANRLREQRRGSARHGSVGLGVGETRRTAQRVAPIRAYDLRSPDQLRRKLRMLCDYLIAEFGDAQPFLDTPLESWVERYSDIGDQLCFGNARSVIACELEQRDVIFEGSQGVLLDQSYGTFPHVTYSHTTFMCATKALPPGAEAVRVGVMRSYMTRHGAGPFVTEDPELRLPEPHNVTDRWQGSFRQGYLDLPALAYAAECCGGVDEIAITHLDRRPAQVCSAYSGMRCFSPQLDQLREAKPIYIDLPSEVALLAYVQAFLKAKVTIGSDGPTPSAKRRIEL